MDGESQLKTNWNNIYEISMVPGQAGQGRRAVSPLPDHWFGHCIDRNWTCGLGDDSAVKS